MFGGLIEALGVVTDIDRRARSLRLTVRAPRLAAAARKGDSIAVNGCCLTVIRVTRSRMSFDVIAETQKRTSMGGLIPGDAVNLERPLTLASPLGGHFVQGHIDEVGRVLSMQKDGRSVDMEVAVSPGAMKYLARKGSVALDGVSLTVAETRPGSIVVALIPHTRRVTTLGSRRVGDTVNVECDVLAKYVEALMREPTVAAAAKP